ncbi:hypothetical protein Acidovoranil_24180 [Acidovorax sp. FG27]
MEGEAEDEAEEAGESGGVGAGRGAEAGAAAGTACGGVADGWDGCRCWTKGVSVCGRVARCAAAGSVGRNSGPRWPQPAIAATLAARAIVLTRIWEALNIAKL